VLNSARGPDRPPGRGRRGRSWRAASSAVSQLPPAAHAGRTAASADDPGTQRAPNAAVVPAADPAGQLVALHAGLVRAQALSVRFLPRCPASPGLTGRPGSCPQANGRRNAMRDTWT
jgi:hypothetical protein